MIIGIYFSYGKKERLQMNYRPLMIRVEKVKKTYSRKLGSVGSYQSLRDLLSLKIGVKKRDVEQFEALNNISFSVKAGEKVGIIGPKWLW